MRSILAIMMTLLVSASASAQLLGPEEVPLTYRLKTGAHYRYHWIVLHRRRVDDPELDNVNFDYVQDISLTVDGVDSAGRATLYVLSQDHIDWRNGLGHLPEMFRSGPGLGIPEYSVVIDSLGRVIEGHVLRENQSDSLLKAGNWIDTPDSARIAFSLGEIMKPRPSPSALLGSTWTDSVYTPRRIDAVYVDGKKQNISGGQAGYTTRMDRYTVSREGGSTLLARHEDRLDMSASLEEPFRSTIASEELLRTDDGMPERYTESYSGEQGTSEPYTATTEMVLVTPP